MPAGPLILAIDQGTTNTKALLVASDGTVVARAARAMASSYPRPTWAEQDAEAIRRSVVEAASEALAGAGGREVAGIALSNQRETLVAWDRDSGRPVAPAILWQCLRTAEASAALREAGHADRVAELSGLAINPMFPASKLAWLLAEVPEAARLAAGGRLAAGTVDAWLVWSLTGGAVLATDHSNASRTQLLDLASCRWSEELAAIFGVPLSVLPDLRPSSGEFGTTAVPGLPQGLPILAVMGDSHAALYGHGARGPGPVKATFGTGTSLMTITDRPVLSAHGLSTTVAWSGADGPLYALEGNITVSAQAAAYMARLLGLADAAALEALAATVPDAGGVTFVPALSGLGAPHWSETARGTIGGLTHDAGPAQLARATYEAIAMQVADVFDAMAQDLGSRPTALLADGGASASPLLMQVQADLLGVPVRPAASPEVGALGAAAMAFDRLGRGWTGSVAAPHPVAPAMDDARRAALRALWSRRVDQAKRS